MTPPSICAREVKDALRRRHANAGAGAWVCLDEAFSGYATWSTGGIDLLAIGAWRTARVSGLRSCGVDSPIDTRNPLVAYEVKVSRSDFRRELYGYTPGEGASWRSRSVPPWPHKAQGAIDRTHYFVFAVPAGLLTEQEIARRTPWTDADATTGPDGQLPIATPPLKRGALWVPEGVGLVEVGARGVRARVDALPTPAQPWTRHEFAEIARRIDYTAAARGLAA